MVQVDGMGLAIGPPARGRMGLALVRARRRVVMLVKVIMRFMVAFVC